MYAGHAKTFERDALLLKPLKSARGGTSFPLSDIFPLNVIRLVSFLMGNFGYIPVQNMKMEHHDDSRIRLFKLVLGDLCVVVLFVKATYNVASKKYFTLG